MRVDLGDLQPEPAALLGQCAYLQLGMFESATAVAGRAAGLTDRESLTRVAAAILQKHHDLVDVLQEHGLESADAMRPYSTDVERYRRRLGDTGWHEGVLTLHLATALLDDFFARLAAGLPGGDAERVPALVAADIGHAALAEIVRAGIAGDRRMTSRLALWGRRIVGDTLLVARAALERARMADGRPAADEDVRVEPVLTELMAAHARRMDELGLTA